MIKFFLDSRIGQTILLAIAITLSAWGMKAYLEHQGYKKCQADAAIDVGKKNVKLYDEQNKRDVKSGEIGKKADAAGEAVIAEVDDTQIKAQEKSDEIYRQPPRTKPVAPGSCVHPVDPGVQDGIDRAVDQANAAYGSL